MVSSIFTSKLQLDPISLLKTIASNIFNFFAHPSKFSRSLYPKKFWTGDSKLGYLLYMGMSALKGSRLEKAKYIQFSRQNRLFHARIP